MPYERQWTDNERAFTFLGIPVYHAYEEDEADERLDYWFHVSAEGTSEEAFDVRDLPRTSEDSEEFLTFLTDGIDDMPRDQISSVQRRIARALWNGQLIPPCYSEQFVLAKIQDTLGGDGGSGVTDDTLGIRLIELLGRYNVFGSTGQCHPLEDEDVGLRAEED